MSVQGFNSTLFLHTEHTYRKKKCFSRGVYSKIYQEVRVGFYLISDMGKQQLEVLRGIKSHTEMRTEFSLAELHFCITQLKKEHDFSISYLQTDI